MGLDTTAREMDKKYGKDHLGASDDILVSFARRIV
jgi:hypothetical protein